MFEFFRNLGQSATDRQQAKISEYVDGLMPASDRQHFEREIAADLALQEQVQQQQAIRQTMRKMPAKRAPRSFSLTPEMAGIQAPRRNWFQQPIFQTAAVMAAFTLVALFAYFSTPGRLNQGDFAAVAVQEVEVTRVVTETIVEGEQVVVTRIVIEEVVRQVEVTRVVEVEVQGEALTAEGTVKSAAPLVGVTSDDEAEEAGEVAQETVVEEAAEISETDGANFADAASEAAQSPGVPPAGTFVASAADSEAASDNNASNAAVTRSIPRPQATETALSRTTDITIEEITPTQLPPTLVPPILEPPEILEPVTNRIELPWNAGIVLIAGILSLILIFFIWRRR